jgi:hypothetical protein
MTVNKLIMKIEFDKIQIDLENYQNKEKFPSTFVAPAITKEYFTHQPHAGFMFIIRM